MNIINFIDPFRVNNLHSTTIPYGGSSIIMDTAFKSWGL
jgi:hypothetical protein